MATPIRSAFGSFIGDKRLAAIALAAVVRMGHQGFKYYPLLDDYIQYGIYPWVEAPFANVYLRIGLYAFRPLAGLGDIYIWGRLWGRLGVALLIITILHALSAYLFIKASENANAPLGMAFAVFYILCPFNFEGSYWISASSRIITGLFFVSLSVFFLTKRNITLFFIFQFISMFLYEQVAVLSFALAILIILKMKIKGAARFTAVNFFVLAVYYALFSSSGRYSYRMDALEIFNFGAVTDIVRLWSVASIYTKGFVRGLGMSGVYFIPVVIASFFMGALERAEKFSLQAVLAGAVLFIMPYMPFLMFSNNNASFRTAAVPLLGAAVAADALLNLIKGFKGTAAGVLTLVFLVIASSELYDYRENYLTDRKIVSYVAQRLEKDRVNAVAGARDTYIEQNAFAAEHIKSVTSADWALTGCVRQYTGDFTVPMIMINPENTENVNLISLYDF